jgi:hypothetical protein
MSARLPRIQCGGAREGQERQILLSNHMVNNRPKESALTGLAAHDSVAFGSSGSGRTKQAVTAGRGAMSRCRVGQSGMRCWTHIAAGWRLPSASPPGRDFLRTRYLYGAVSISNHKSVSNVEKTMKFMLLKSGCLVLSSAGLALLSTGCKVQPLKVSCNASAPSIYAGDAETVTATPASVATKKHWDVVYDWSGPGVTGNGTTATVNTGSLDPGNYTVKADAKEGKKGKEGTKKNTTASCSSDFTVKPFDPPTVSCSANPASLMSGGSSTITATGLSPQNRPLTYSFSSSSGSISGNGNTATLSTTGAPAGVVTVTCSVQDDKSHSVSSTTTVNVQVPPPPPPPNTQTLCSIQFDHDTRRPTRVDNEAKACLDDVALNAQQKADATIVLVGNSAPPPEQKGHHHRGHELTAADLAAQRAVNTKDYLVTDKGIDASRIQVKTGTSGQNEVSDYLVPPGANFDSDVPGTTAVDENAVKAQPRNPHPMHHHSHAKQAAAGTT